MQGPYCEILSPKFVKYGPSLRDPCVKDECFVFHGTAKAISLINSLLYGEKENIPEDSPRIRRQLPKNYFLTKLIQNHFPKVFC